MTFLRMTTGDLYVSFQELGVTVYGYLHFLGSSGIKAGESILYAATTKEVKVTVNGHAKFLETYV